MANVQAITEVWGFTANSAQGEAFLKGFQEIRNKLRLE